MRALKMPGLVLGGGAAIVLAALTVGSVGCGSTEVVLSVSVNPDGKVRADGKTAATISVSLTQDGKPVADGGAVHFSSNLDGSAFATIEDAASISDDSSTKDATVTAGSATAKIYSVKSGTAHVNINYTDEASGQTASKGTDIDFGSDNPTVASLVFVSAEPSSIALKGSGREETSKVTFQAKDANGGNIPAGVTVSFAVGSDLGGATVEPASSKTDDAGRAFTVLKAGTQPGTIKVKATSGAVSADSPPIAITGGAVNYRNFSWKCEEYGIAGFAAYNLKMHCTALLADRNTQKVPNQQVTFMAEAGAIDQFILSDELGEAVAEYRTQDPQPADVPPLTSWSVSSNKDEQFILNGTASEPSRQGTCANGKVGTCNPRDGLVTVIAVTSGEEEWTDSNRNGQWDDGEPFIDLPEPYVDVNDNGKFDPDDPKEKDLYIDANKNGQWDDKNGKWDGATTIWKPIKFVWTGLATSEFKALNGTVMPASVNIPHCPTNPVSMLLYVHDANLNFPANTAGDSLSCSCINNVCTGKPDMYGVHNDTYGYKAITVAVGDGHVCSPDCHNDPEPCTAAADTFTCTGEFNSIGGHTQSLGAGGTGAQQNVYQN